MDDENRSLNGYIGVQYVELHDKTDSWSEILSPDKKVWINLSDKYHKCLMGITGSGKSYGARILCEEIIEKNIGYGVIIIDPLGVYCSMKTPNDSKDIDKWNRMLNRVDIRPKGFEDCEIWIPEGAQKTYDENSNEKMYDYVFGINVSDISIDSMCDAFRLDATSPQINLLRDCKADLKTEKYDLNKLISTIKGREDYSESTIHALVGRLRALDDMGILSKREFNLHEMIKKNKTIILDLSFYDTENSRLIVNFLCEKLMKSRRIISRKIEIAMSKNSTIEINDYIPPIQLIIDEAHFFLEDENKILLQAIKTGRNNGLILTLITQSFDIPKRMLGNVSQLFIGKMSMVEDIEKAYKMTYTTMSLNSFKILVKGLSEGKFLYIGIIENKFFKFKFRPSLTRHPATTKNIDEEIYLRGNEIKDPIFKLKNVSLDFHDIPDDLGDD